MSIIEKKEKTHCTEFQLIKALKGFMLYNVCAGRFLEKYSHAVGHSETFMLVCCKLSRSRYNNMLGCGSKEQNYVYNN